MALQRNMARIKKLIFNENTVVKDMSSMMHDADADVADHTMMRVQGLMGQEFCRTYPDDTCKANPQAA
jgi:hypothetical protein